MTYLRAFIAGVALPTVLLPFILCLAVYLGNPQLLTLVVIHWVPIFWGIWNIFYFTFFRNAIDLNSAARLFIWGAIFGLILASYAVFVVHLSTFLGLPIDYKYFPLIVMPVVYGLLWMLIVKPLNKLFGLVN